MQIFLHTTRKGQGSRDCSMSAVKTLQIINDYKMSIHFMLNQLSDTFSFRKPGCKESAAGTLGGSSSAISAFGCVCLPLCLYICALHPAAWKMLIGVSTLGPPNTSWELQASYITSLSLLSLPSCQIQPGQFVLYIYLLIADHYKESAH